MWESYSPDVATSSFFRLIKLSLNHFFEETSAQPCSLAIFGLTLREVFGVPLCKISLPYDKNDNLLWDKTSSFLRP